ncbi:uncharacterized protein LOC128931702 [Callithrix jacchus]
MKSTGEQFNCDLQKAGIFRLMKNDSTLLMRKPLSVSACSPAGSFLRPSPEADAGAMLLVQSTEPPVLANLGTFVVPLSNQSTA